MQRTLYGEALSRAPRPESVLEIGCGKGILFQALVNAFPNAELSAVDPSRKAVSVTCARVERMRCVSAYPKKSNSHVRVVQAAVENLPFSANSLALVLACRSFHHWENKQVSLEEVYRVLQPGGLFLIGDFLLTGAFQNKFLKGVVEITDGGKFSTPEEFYHMLTVAGFGLAGLQIVPTSGRTSFVCAIAK